MAARPRPCLERHPAPVPASCDHCWLYSADPRYHLHWGGDAATFQATAVPRPGRRPAPRTGRVHFVDAHPTRTGRRYQLRVACPHEGPIVSHGSKETCHVRHCLHPQAEWDLCTRGPGGRDDSVKSCGRCDLHPIVRIAFAHGIGDATNFAHLIPLYTRRGYTVQVACRPDEAPVFLAGGAQIITDAAPNHPWGHAPAHALVPWPQPWNRNKNGWNLFGGNPFTRLKGNPADLWREYTEVRLDFGPQVTDADRARADEMLAGARRPIIACHHRGFEWGSYRDYPDDLARDLWRRLVAETGGTVVVLDRDARAARLDHPDVRYFQYYWPREMYEVMRRADLFIGIDSGPLNFVRFMDVPAVGIWREHYPSDYLLPRENTVHVVQSRHAQRDRYEREHWNTIVAPDEGPSPAFVAQVVGRVLAGPRYLPAGPIARDVQLQHHVDRTDSTFRHDFGHRVDRHRTFDAALRFLGSRPAPVIVETGTIRAEEDWAGAGFSTYLWSEFLTRHGGELHSVDLTPRYVEFAREWTRQFPAATIHERHSHEFLRAWSGPPIDLLYCDSADTDTAGYQECCLAEIELALPLLAPDARILIDDTPPDPAGGWQGKGGLAVPWLLDRGWEIETSGWQVLLRRSL